MHRSQLGSERNALSLLYTNRRRLVGWKTVWVVSQRMAQLLRNARMSTILSSGKCNDTYFIAISSDSLLLAAEGLVDVWLLRA